MEELKEGKGWFLQIRIRARGRSSMSVFTKAASGSSLVVELKKTAQEQSSSCLFLFQPHLCLTPMEQRGEGTAGNIWQLNV